MKRFLTWLALLPLCAISQTVRQPLSSKYTGLGAYSKSFADIFSGSANQAALAQMPGGGFGVYGERRFMLSELSQFSAILAVPTSSGTFALQADYFGSASFNENQLGLAYGRSVTRQVDVGVKFNYHNISTPGYGTASAINFEAGTLVHLTEKLHAGFHVYNPFSSKFSKSNNEKLPGIFKTGVGYEVSENFFISGEAVKQEDMPVSINAGFQYHLQQIILRAGISTAANNSFAGMGIKLGRLRVDINAAYHNQLGFTPGLLLLYHFKKEDKD